MATTLEEPSTGEAFASYRPLDDAVLSARIEAARRQMGAKLVILGHHYQQDGVIAHADLQGDSYQLSKSASERTACEAIAFCGVHFMAETADILANRPEQVAARGGKRGGQLYGSSDSAGHAVDQDGVSPADFNATIATALGLPLTKEIFSPTGRPFKVAHDGKAIAKLL